MIGERLKRARRVSGLSMQALASQIGVSTNMVKKYEHNISMPSSKVLMELCNALDVKSEYFFRPPVSGLQNLEYRKRSTVPRQLLMKIEADVLDQAERWMELSSLWPNFPIPSYKAIEGINHSISSLDEVEVSAEKVRKEWNLGSDPIHDLVDLLESKGILVIFTEVGEGEKFDGLLAFLNEMPIIAISSQWPGDRQRFTLAHELGHLVLHESLSPELNKEDAANRFAGAFLAPKDGVLQLLGSERRDIEPRELYLLKQEFGLSMKGWLHRAKDLAVIKPSKYSKLSATFNREGWKTKEPGEPYPKESTHLFQQLIYRALGEEIVGQSKAAELLGLPASTFRKQRNLDASESKVTRQ